VLYQITKVTHPNCFFIDSSMLSSSIHLCVTLSDGRQTEIIYRSVAANSELLTSALELATAIKQPANCRTTRLDLGKMFGLGFKSGDQNYSQSNKVSSEMGKFAAHVSRQMRVDFPAVFHSIAEATPNRFRPCRNMGDNHFCPGRTLYATINYTNSAHWDFADASYTFALWVHTGSSPKSWFFVFPDLSINGSQGVAFRLFHGAAISWDGRVLRHCTSLPSEHHYGIRAGFGFVAAS
jgi:hypothetical protein